MPRLSVLLSEQAEREESEDRARLRAIDSRLDQLYGRRAELVGNLHRWSEEQRKLNDRRRPSEEALERSHGEHRSLGRRLIELRREREAARHRLDEAIVAARLLRPARPREDRQRPEALRREIRALELRQQTTALPLTEENALIDRLRQLNRLLTKAEEGDAAFRAVDESRRKAEEGIRSRRLELDRVNETIERTRRERDSAMAAMRAKLEEMGQLVAAIREAGSRRHAAFDEVRGLSGEIAALEQEGNRLLEQSRVRRDDARRALREHSRGRGPVPVEAAINAHAEANLEELLKRGRVTLGG